MAFRQSDGAVVWKSGHFLTSGAAPILIDFEGTPQMVFLAGGTVTALNPDNGEILWSHPHDPGNDLNCATPIWGSDNVLFVSSAYRAGSRAIQLKRQGTATVPEELWFTNRVRFMFLNPVRLGDFIYDTTGDFGPSFLTALDIKTGQSAWQHRGFSRASLLQAGDKTIIMDEDGDLALARLTPAGVTILSRAKIFDTTAWTAPTLVGTTLYARDREKIVALDLGATGAQGQGMRQAQEVQRSASPAPTAASAPPTSPASALMSGSWRLDTAASRVDSAAGLAGLIGAGAPPMLYVTQPANGTLIVESPINESHVRIYRPGVSTQTPVGQGGTITMTSAWGPRTLTSEGTSLTAAGASADVKETYSVSADGQILTIEVKTAAPDAKSSTLKYTRITDVGRCDSWPTPCKRF